MGHHFYVAWATTESESIISVIVFHLVNCHLFVLPGHYLNSKRKTYIRGVHKSDFNRVQRAVCTAVAVFLLKLVSVYCCFGLFKDSRWRDVHSGSIVYFRDIVGNFSSLWNHAHI